MHYYAWNFTEMNKSVKMYECPMSICTQNKCMNNKMHKNNNHVIECGALQPVLVGSVSFGRIRIHFRKRWPGVGSGSWPGSVFPEADPDPHQNEADTKNACNFANIYTNKNITYPAHLQDVEKKCLAPNKILFLFKDLTRSIYLFLSR